MLFDKNCCGNFSRQNIDMVNQPRMPIRMSGQVCSPIIEPTMTQCIERDFCYEVPHICPKHTHIINRHIFRHTYTPQYSTSEENQVINVNDGNCCQF